MCSSEIKDYLSRYRFTAGGVLFACCVSAAAGLPLGYVLGSYEEQIKRDEIAKLLCRQSSGSTKLFRCHIVKENYFSKHDPIFECDPGLNVAKFCDAIRKVSSDYHWLTPAAFLMVMLFVLTVVGYMFDARRRPVSSALHS